MFRIIIDSHYFVRLNKTDHRKDPDVNTATLFQTEEEAKEIIKRQSLETIFEEVKIEKV